MKTYHRNIPRDKAGQIVSEGFYRQYLYNQRVLLIGGADIDLKLYEEANYDVWIRINNHYQRQGGTVDAIYTSGVQEPGEGLSGAYIIECHPLPQQIDSAWSNLPNAHYLRYDTNLYKETNPHGPEHEWLNNLYRKMNTMPLTGMIAVCHLLSMPIKSLELAGFDFYQADGRSPVKRDSHYILPQIAWLAEQYIVDARLSVSEELSKRLCYTYWCKQL